MNLFKKQAILLGLLAAKKAGEQILVIYEKDFQVEFKEDESPLTIADLASHKVIAELLANHPLGKLNGKALPLLSEEGKSIPYETRREWERYWLVDPIDGTKEFIKRNGEFTVNIALMEGKPIAGIISVPIRDVYYFAAEGFGSYLLEGRNFPVGLEGEWPDSADKGKTNALFDAVVATSTKLPMNPELNNPLVIIGSRSHKSPQLNDFIEHLSATRGEVDVVTAGSSLKFCLVAEGKADIYPRFGLTSEWDIAAGQIIAEESGSSVCNMETGKAMEYNKKDLLNPHFMVKRNGFSESKP